MSTADTAMAAPPVEETLVARRSRRSTAGNRMEAALAEMSIDDAVKDPDDDVDFSVDKYEEDVFESDFESTDEEAQEDAGEQEALDEEKQTRKAARTRVEKATAAAHARQKVTFNPEASSSSAPKTKLRPKRRVSLGTAVNAETGEVIKGDAKGQRHSKRIHTIKNTSATVKRFKKGEERRAAQAPKVKALTREITQGELIARALDNEEGNIVEHRDYLKLEEEKRKRARVVRDAVEGPLLRWVSRGEDTKIQVEVTPPAPPAATPAYGYGHGYGAYNAPGTSTPPAYPYYSPATTTHYQNPYMHYLPPPAPLPAPVFEERTESVTKNYLVHELAQYEKAPKPSWTESMEVIFGDHVRWDQVKVYSGKGRPTSRPKQMCPLTGQPALYLDPRTGVPFANIWAYEMLTKLLNHEFVWSTALRCYVRQEEPPTEDNMDTS
ncbi:YL1 nuclear protein-domain-containing protein [Desarmillaria ectypa]|nr:YL1 nuclear protein-domain-containing protein [Desarmillaria ectypa]